MTASGNYPTASASGNYPTAGTPVLGEATYMYSTPAGAQVFAGGQPANFVPNTPAGQSAQRTLSPVTMHRAVSPLGMRHTTGTTSQRTLSPTRHLQYLNA